MTEKYSYFMLNLNKSNWWSLVSITVPASFALMMWCGYFDLLRRGVAWRGVVRDSDGSAYPRNSQGVAHKRCLPQSVSVIPDLRSNLSDVSSPGFSGSGMEGAESWYDTARPV